MPNVSTETLPPFPEGMNVALPASELSDGEARLLQDGLVDYPGMTRQRGPVEAVDGLALLQREATGLFATLDPKGSARYAALTGNSENGYFTVWAPDLASNTDLTWPHPLPTSPETSAAQAYRIVDAKASIDGGSWVGVSSQYSADSPNQGLALWKGATKANYSTGTITVSRGSASVSGSGVAWSANAEPGMFLFATTDEGYTMTLVGCVRLVNGDTSLTLDKVSPYAATAKAYTLQALRGFAPRVTTGMITCATDSTTVNGGDTKFQSQELNVGTWQLYRQSDMVYIGKVSAVNSELSLTLTANAAIACADTPYVAIRADADYSIETTANVNKVGFLNATYAERQWFANNGAEFDKTHRVWFTDVGEPEQVDLSTDGDWIPISSTRDMQEPIHALAPAFNALLVMKDSETFGIYGSSPSTFSAKKLWDDGALSGMSIQLYGGGVIWAGREGIHYYDGIQITNMTQEKLGDVWMNSVGANFDPTRYRMWSMITRNHYFLFIERLNPSIPIVKGNTSETPDRWGVVINMKTRAVTMATNIDARGSVILPGSATNQVWYIVNGASTTTFGRLSVGATLNNLTADKKNVWKATLPFDGTVSKLTMRMDGWGPGSGSQVLKGVIYSDSAGNPSVLKGTSTEVTITHGQAQGWVDFVFSTPVALTAGTYWIGTIAGGTSQVARFLADTTGGFRANNTDTYSDGPADPFGSVTLSDNFSASIYATYTETQHGIVCNADSLFDREALDTVTCKGAVMGPNFYVETKKFNAGDALRLKRYKLLLLHYLVQGTNLKVDTVLGLNDIGQTLSYQFPASNFTWSTLGAQFQSWTALGQQYATWSSIVDSVFLPKRTRFLKKSQHFALRIYPVTRATRLRLGPFQIGFKEMRPGRAS